MANTKIETTVIDLDKPYLGWFDHYQAGWQAVLVYQRDGKRVAHRLGDAVSYERATEMCRVLAEQTRVQCAGELSKSGFALPVATAEETSNG